MTDSLLSDRPASKSYDVPANLYIPPQAMVVVLESFEGPLDLLLHLIRKHDFDILDIKISEVTEQYVRFIDLMTALKLELAGEYLLMAATLAEIKSKTLLPVLEAEEEDQEDPRARLMRQLLEYSRFKTAAERLDALPRAERDFQPVAVEADYAELRPILPDVDLRDLVLAMADVLRHAVLLEAHQIASEPLSVRERMTSVLALLRGSPESVQFESLFAPREGKPGVVVTVLALMELLKDRMVDLSQSTTYGPIRVRGLFAAEEELS